MRVCACVFVGVVYEDVSVICVCVCVRGCECVPVRGSVRACARACV